jgi:prevent-host-death family protein
MKLARDIQSLSTFKRETTRLLKQMKKTKEPIVLTINGEAALVVQDVESYQKVLEAKERMETIAILRRRLATLEKKKGRPAEEFFAEFFAEHDIDE